MCICRTCCCGCTLRQGSVGIIITEGIFFGIQFFYTLILTAFAELLERSFDHDLGTVKALLWIAMIPTFGRFLVGCISGCSGFKVSLRLVHFIGHVVSDVLSVVLAIALYAISSVDVFSLITNIIYLALFIYFDWILYCFWKEDEIMKKEEAENPSQIVVQQGQPVQG